VPIRLNGPFDGRLGLEVRGKYARPVHYANGVFRIDSEVKPPSKRETGMGPWGYATWSGQPHSHTIPVTPQHRAHTAAAEAPLSSTKPPSRYASELQALIKQERTVLCT